MPNAEMHVHENGELDWSYSSVYTVNVLLLLKAAYFLYKKCTMPNAEMHVHENGELDWSQCTWFRSGRGFAWLMHTDSYFPKIENL